jgi:hypothetical protein
VTERRGRRRRKLLDDFKKRKGCSHLKEDALHRTMRGAGFRRGFEPVVRQTAKLMNENLTVGYLSTKLYRIYVRYTNITLCIAFGIIRGLT